MENDVVLQDLNNSPSPKYARSRENSIEKSTKVTFAPDPTTLKINRFCAPRLVERSGPCNVESRTINNKRQKFLHDIFTTLLDTQWRFLLPVFTVMIIATWILFAVIYYVTASVHGDFLEIKRSEDWKDCIENAPDFSSMLLFSMETQTTIGYGYRYVNDQCSVAILTMLIQSILGAFLQALLTGMVIAKVQKPKKRANTILFSRNVCILEENGVKYLTIRVGDLQRTDMIDAHARAVCVKDRITHDGDFVSHFRYDLDLWSEKTTDRINLRWPCVLRHRITPSSPFWDMNEDDCKTLNFELIVFLEGIIETTGMTVSSRTSYLPNDFRWERKFKQMTAKWKSTGNFDFDYCEFHETVPSIVNTPNRIRRKTFLLRRTSPTDSCYGTESGNGESCETEEEDVESDETGSFGCEAENDHDVSFESNFLRIVSDGRRRKISTESGFSMCSDANTRKGMMRGSPMCSYSNSPKTQKISTVSFDNLNYYSE